MMTFVMVIGWTGEPSLFDYEELDNGPADISQSFARYLYREHVRDSAADFRYDRREGTEYYAPIPMTFRWKRVTTESPLE